MNPATPVPTIRDNYLGIFWTGLSSAVILFSLLAPSSVFAEARTSQPSLPDYRVSELSTLASLDDLLPANLYDIELVIFKRLDTSESLLAIEPGLGEEPGQPDSTTETKKNGPDSPDHWVETHIDPREPLLLTTPRLLPNTLYALSAQQGDHDGTGHLTPDDTPKCWPVTVDPDPETDLSGQRKTRDIEPSPKSVNQLTSDLGSAPEDQPSLARNDGAEASGLDTAQAPDTTDLRGIAQELQPFSVATQPVPLGASSVKVTPYLKLVRELSAFADHIEADQYRRRPQATLNLGTHAQRLEGSGEFQVLVHLGWHQKVPDREAPQSIYLHFEDELQGYLAVTLGRYLHTAATLWLYPSDSLSGPSAANNDENPLRATRPYAQLKQSRRMRSGELHYFDHPLFGVLVRIDKVKHPEATKQLFDQFKDSRALVTVPEPSSEN